MQKQAERFGARSEYAEVLRMDLTAVPKLVETSEGIFLGKTVVLATGANPRTLGVARESELVGRGVAYCAACDGMFYKGKTVVAFFFLFFQRFYTFFQISTFFICAYHKSMFFFHCTHFKNSSMYLNS